jgi:hypothetical protein
VRAERAREAAVKPAPVKAKPEPSQRKVKANGATPKPGKARDEQRLEAQIEAAEAALRAVEDELADPAAWADPARSATSSARHAEAKQAVEELYRRWEQVATG